MKSQYWIIIGTSIIICSLIVNISYPQKLASEYLLLQNLKFNTNWLTQAAEPPEKDQLYEIPVPEFTFQTQVPQKAQKMFLEFAYICEPQCDQVWLEIQGDQPENQLTQFLIYDSTLDNITWFYTSDGTLQFYQKQGEYLSPQDFLQNNTQDILYTEPQIANLLRIPYDRYQPIDNNLDLNTSNYILTTYQFPKNQGKWRLGRSFDMSNIIKDLNGFITWKLIHKSEDQVQPRIWMSKPNIDYSLK